MGSGAGTPAIATKPAEHRRAPSGNALSSNVPSGPLCASASLFICDRLGEMRSRRAASSPRMTVKDQADRAISTGQLHALLRFHTRPINVVVSHGSQARPGFEGGFPLRCFQRLSRPHIATRLCRWRDNRSTRGASTPVLSY